MDFIKEFVIPFGGLKIGIHHFDFEIDDQFFEHFKYSEIKKGKVTVHLKMEKEEKMLLLKFSLEGNVRVPCDRCYEPVDIRINGDESLIVKPGDGYYEESEEIQIIPEGDTQLDISPFLYEYVHLLLPVRRTHPEDENGKSLCNPEIVKRIDEISTSLEPDPRWEILKKLKTKN